MSSDLNVFLDQNIVSIIATVAIGLITVLGFVFKFLNNTNDSIKYNNENLKKYNQLKEDVERLKKKSEQSLKFTIADKEKILNDIGNRLRDESEQDLIENLESKIKRNIFEEIFNDQIERSILRLRNEKNSAFIRGNFNLIIGVLISTLGGFIAFTFIGKLPIAGTVVNLLSYTLPRLSFFMLIILLAFFFLNLYRKSMEDIKYYQNEITNLEAKYLSLQMAKSMNNHKLISSILEQLVKTERNFVLEKDQSTIELEKERISSNNANNTLQAVKDIFISKK